MGAVSGDRCQANVAGAGLEDVAEVVYQSLVIVKLRVVDMKTIFIHLLSPAVHGCPGSIGNHRWHRIDRSAARPMLPPEEYARRLTESRRLMVEGEVFGQLLWRMLQFWTRAHPWNKFKVRLQEQLSSTDLIIWFEILWDTLRFSDVSLRFRACCSILQGSARRVAGAANELQGSQERSEWWRCWIICKMIKHGQNSNIVYQCIII